jgi:hypothetical protein
MLSDSLSWEWSDLFDSDYPRVRSSACLEFRFNVKGDFARAQNHFLGRAITKVFRNSRLEDIAWSEFLDVGVCSRVFEADFWSGDNQRFSVVAKHLSAKYVEVVGWGCALS